VSGVVWGIGGIEGLKRAAAFTAVDRYVRNSMIVGLGSGTTAAFVVARIGDLLAGGALRDVRGIPTSERTAALAREASVPLVALSEARPTLTIDGADEIGPDLAVIKGRGGALLREKIVAAASERGLVIVADGSKPVATLGEGRLPVEVEPFGWETTLEALGALGCEPVLRVDRADPQHPFVTDGGHYTADCLFPGISDPASLEAEIKRLPGALECGLFVGLARAAVVARESGVEITEAG
jgi:ribose 5-phosphate isomerase A